MSVCVCVQVTECHRVHVGVRGQPWVFAFHFVGGRVFTITGKPPNLPQEYRKYKCGLLSLALCEL